MTDSTAGWADVHVNTHTVHDTSYLSSCFSLHVPPGAFTQVRWNTPQNWTLRHQGGEISSTAGGLCYCKHHNNIFTDVEDYVCLRGPQLIRGHARGLSSDSHITGGQSHREQEHWRMFALRTVDSEQSFTVCWPWKHWWCDDDVTLHSWQSCPVGMILEASFLNSKMKLVLFKK